ncbi:ABC transporter permease [Rhodospirillum rubrum]|uniref:Binding-protein-dependent transport systems inner membrane component n=1 Tax=Rhodospirillum rubrum (strain ATCC 11170 / ATH 1.1.1 / DSM 467 / LMG 4362 / NCIMB 8255 / S1) TaxID=269796 RepID=Q2RTV2_RHORT|nr:ABC transporter permease [Rhodospirillum rubrum]ABC22443.1 Binding-protein-dependent transport systems inner membrane component [Rhodospirillum rubrum ATCC 11170]AEO48161.1 binding-protein dependent transport system inner membrane protein [Rhodospirillum rubrum F11]MBK5954025.1 ABC transporter permease [Rhodospirillum rubrum]QXG82078.1 ABC transporter permease [Rhodospirillum rubrum]HCF16877.1 ABC transporter permease [Rhodospirillum rubrum]
MTARPCRRGLPLRLAGIALSLGALIGLWHLAFVLAGARPYLLPSPWQTAQALIGRWPTILPHAGTTALEIVLGLGLGTLLGALSALTIALSPLMRRMLLPLLVISQAIPVFAIAPLLVLWLGYGLASKVAMATLVIYFPVTTAFLDGLRRTEPGWLDLARTMGASPLSTLLRIRLPAALPALASGLRVATAVAPIGAVVGEWVGSSAGLGYLMLHANARMQIDLMFAALFVLTVFSLGLYALVDRTLRAALPWQRETLDGD